MASNKDVKEHLVEVKKRLAKDYSMELTPAEEKAAARLIRVMLSAEMTNIAHKVTFDMALSRVEF